MILNDLILDHTHAGFGHSQLGKRNPGTVGGRRGGQEDPIHLLLGEGGVALLSGAAAGNGLFQLFGVGDGDIMTIHE